MEYGEQEVAPRKRGMTPIRVTLAAGVPQRFGIEGDWIACITAAASDLTARFDASEPVPLPAGLGFRRYYREVELESATGGAFLVLAGFGSVADARAVVTANLTVNTEPGNTLSDGGDIACAATAVTLLSALDATRLVLTVSNPSTNTETLRIGTVAVAAATGFALEPGESISLATTAAVYAYNPGAGPQTVAVGAVQQV
jgi:hypothetical protein